MHDLHMLEGCTVVKSTCILRVKVYYKLMFFCEGRTLHYKQNDNVWITDFGATVLKWHCS